MSTPDLSVPGLGKTESAGIILVGALVAYVLYRVYSTGSGIAKSVGDTLEQGWQNVTGAATAVTDAAKLASDQVALNTVKTNNAMGGAAPIPVQDQTDAETARLNALAGQPRSASPVPDAPTESWDAMGTYTGLQGNIVTEQQLDSPGANDNMTPIDFGTGGGW